MAKAGKRIRKIYEGIDRDHLYPLAERPDGEGARGRQVR
jgi:hypothetical protein